MLVFSAVGMRAEPSYSSRRDDVLVTGGALVDIVGEWRPFLSEDTPEKEIALLRRHERTGRPLGGDSFIDRFEKTSGRILRRQKPGPKPKRGSK